MEPENNRSRGVIIGAIVLVLVILGLIYWASRSGTTPPENTAAVGELGDGELGTAALTVSDPFPGEIVFVSQVNLPAGGFVVVRKLTDETAGEVVGANYFDAELHAGEVPITGGTRDGERYEASLYSDNGDKRFVAGDDLPLVGPDGQPVASRFGVTTVLPERKG